MFYENLRSICRVNHISLVSICREIGITQAGLKRGMENGTLGLRFVMPICECLHITPNKLFGVSDGNITSQTQNGGVGNTQIMEDGTATLQEQLHEKDRQIDRLLTLLEKK